jgi:hypothetical protein
MRHLDIMAPRRWLITESKARIDHPEDFVFDGGSQGAKRALSALLHAAENPHMVTIKWDGSPALIFGRDEDGFTLTDKSGFSNKKPTGLPRSASELNNMLFMRKPDEPNRERYAQGIASIFDQLESMVPETFRGFIHGDLLWLGRPPVANGAYVFKPNKVSYSIPVSSPLGQLISRSKVGIAVHGLYGSREDSEPESIDDVDSIGLRTSQDVVTMGSQISDLERTPLPKALITKMEGMLGKLSPSIDRFLDKSALSSRQITDLPDLMKRYLNSRAYAGTHGFSDAANGFSEWVSSFRGLTERKRANILKWLEEHRQEHAATWSAIDLLTTLKDRIKSDIDRQTSTKVGTELGGKPGHEGYVADTPQGRIKMVNRPHFMRKEF